MENPEQRRFSVIAGVKEEGDALGFVQKLQSFVKPDPIDLLLVHAVTEKAKVPSFYKELLGKFDITELDNRQLPDGEMKRALARQQQLTGQLGKEPNTQVRLAFADDAATALIDEAQRVGSSLIAVEVEQHLYQFIPGGLSVALSLMLFSPVPVLLIRRESKNNFAQREHSLIIADDLSSASLSAVRKGLEMAAKWGHTHVIHVHAIDRSLHTTLKDLAEISKKVDAGFLATPELFSLLEKQMADTLRDRAQHALPLLNSSGCTYEPLIQVGNVANKIGGLLRERKPDLAVFGRRPSTQRTVFGVGRVPFAAMLADSDAVLIVP